jgi:hypothetical protein
VAEFAETGARFLRGGNLSEAGNGSLRLRYWKLAATKRSSNIRANLWKRQFSSLNSE